MRYKVKPRGNYHKWFPLGVDLDCPHCQGKGDCYKCNDTGMKRHTIKKTGAMVQAPSNTNLYYYVGKR